MNYYTKNIVKWYKFSKIQLKNYSKNNFSFCFANFIFEFHSLDSRGKVRHIFSAFAQQVEEVILPICLFLSGAFV